MSRGTIPIWTYLAARFLPPFYPVCERTLLQYPIDVAIISSAFFLRVEKIRNLNFNDFNTTRRIRHFGFQPTLCLPPFSKLFCNLTVAEFGNQVQKRREQRGRICNTRPCDLAGFTGSRCNNTISDTHASRSMVNLRGGNVVRGYQKIIRPTRLRVAYSGIGIWFFFSINHHHSRVMASL